jgi:hypothetical protein
VFEDLEEEVALLLESQERKRDKIDALLQIEVDAKEREKVVIKLVALER